MRRLPFAPSRVFAARAASSTLGAIRSGGSFDAFLLRPAVFRSAFGGIDWRRCVQSRMSACIARTAGVGLAFYVEPGVDSCVNGGSGHDVGTIPDQSASSESKMRAAVISAARSFFVGNGQGFTVTHGADRTMIVARRVGRAPSFLCVRWPCPLLPTGRGHVLCDIAANSRRENHYFGLTRFTQTVAAAVAFRGQSQVPSAPGSVCGCGRDSNHAISEPKASVKMARTKISRLLNAHHTRRLTENSCESALARDH